MTDHYLKAAFRGNEIRISALCAMTYIYFCRYDLLNFAKVFSFVGVMSYLCMAAFIVLFTIFTLTDSRNICLDGILIILFAAAFFIITLELHPEYSYRFMAPKHDGKHSAMAVFSFGTPLLCYYLTRLFRNEEEKMYRLLKVMAFTIVCCNIWSLTIKDTAVKDYNMGFGYEMEMAAIIFITVYMYEKKDQYLLFSIAAMGLGVLYGSRACIIGYVLYIPLFFLWDRSFDRRKAALVILGAAGVVIYKTRFVIKLIYDIFDSMGLYSRTLYYIARGDILEPDQARQDNIWPVLIKAVKEIPPFKMLGAFGDRTLIDDDYVYAHNIFLEVLLTFGIILGSAFFIWMLYQLIQVIRKNRGMDGLFVIIFGTFSMCRLFFSNSIWEEPHFWMFIALLINCALNRRVAKFDDDN